MLEEVYHIMLVYAIDKYGMYAIFYFRTIVLYMYDYIPCVNYCQVIGLQRNCINLRKKFQFYGGFGAGEGSGVARFIDRHKPQGLVCRNVDRDSPYYRQSYGVSMSLGIYKLRQLIS